MNASLVAAQTYSFWEDAVRRASGVDAHHLLEQRFPHRRQWRNLGDLANNDSSVGNQQTTVWGALAELHTNALDGCIELAWERHLLQHPNATMPMSPHMAVEQLIGETPEPYDAQGGAKWIAWSLSSGLDKYSSVTVVDRGIGQHPERFPQTLLSLMRTNKTKKPYLHGRHNHGSNGSLRFCSLKAIMSRRAPDLVDGSGEWGFTFVREYWVDDTYPVWEYLAPVGADQTPRMGSVLSFPHTAGVALLPKRHRRGGKGPQLAEEFSLQLEHGTFVKLWDCLPTTDSGLPCQNKLFVANMGCYVPRSPLPAYSYQCNPMSSEYKSEGWNRFTLRGVVDRFKPDHLEVGFPEQHQLSLDIPGSGGTIHVGGELTIYVERLKSQTSDYRFTREHGLLVDVGGQTHALLNSRFIRRCGFDSLRGDVLVHVNLDVDARAVSRIFKRDREGTYPEYFNPVLEEITLQVARSKLLRRVADKRRKLPAQRSRVSSRAELLCKKLLRSRNYQKLLGPSNRGTKARSGISRAGKHPVHPKIHPERWELEPKPKDTQPPTRHTTARGRVTLTFLTDAVDYFFDLGTGELEVLCKDGSSDTPKMLADYDLTITNGIAKLVFRVPNNQNQTLCTVRAYDCLENDIRTLGENNILLVPASAKAADPTEPTNGKRPPKQSEAHEAALPKGLPRRVWVYRNESDSDESSMTWEQVEQITKRRFTGVTGCEIADDGANGKVIYLNGDNDSLRELRKQADRKPGGVTALVQAYEDFLMVECIANSPGYENFLAACKETNGSPEDDSSPEYMSAVLRSSAVKFGLLYDLFRDIRQDLWNKTDT